LETTNTKQDTLIVVVVVGVLVGVVHIPAVGVVAIVLTTPPIAVVADIVEITAGITETTRQSRKAELVCAVAIVVPATRSFQELANCFASIRTTSTARDLVDANH